MRLFVCIAFAFWGQCASGRMKITVLDLWVDRCGIIATPCLSGKHEKMYKLCNLKAWWFLG